MRFRAGRSSWPADTCPPGHRLGRGVPACAGSGGPCREIGPARELDGRRDRRPGHDQLRVDLVVAPDDRFAGGTQDRGHVRGGWLRRRPAIRQDDSRIVVRPGDAAGQDYSIQAPALWQSTLGSKSLVVAVVDGGIVSHTDLPKTVAGYDMIADKRISRVVTAVTAVPPTRATGPTAPIVLPTPVSGTVHTSRGSSPPSTTTARLSRACPWGDDPVVEVVYAGDDFTAISRSRMKVKVSS